MKLPRRPRVGPILLASSLFAVAFSGCGEDTVEGGAVIRTADGVQLIDPDEAELITSEAAAGADTAAGDATAEGDTSDAAAGDSSDAAFDEETADTVPVDDDRSPDEVMFDAFNDFRGCLDERGTQFIGAPDASGEGPTNDPAYLESLSVCAAQSNIVEALESQQSALEDMTPEQVEERNEGVLNFAECMEGRGFTVEMTTGENGMLTPSNMVGPNGESALDGGTDLEDCAAESQAAAEAEEDA